MVSVWGGGREKKKLPLLKYRCVQIFHHRIIKKGWPTAAMTYRRKLAPITHPQPKSPGIFLLGQVWPKSQPTFKMQMIFGPLDGTNSLSIFAHLGLLVVSLGQPCRLKRGYSIFGWPIRGGRERVRFKFIHLNLLILPSKKTHPSKQNPSKIFSTSLAWEIYMLPENWRSWRYYPLEKEGTHILKAPIFEGTMSMFVLGGVYACVFNFWACKGKE